MKDIKWFLKNNIVLLDGAMGTMLQKMGLKLGEYPEQLNLTKPDIIATIHRQYLKSGANVIYTNTFGANSHKLPKHLKLEDVVSAAIKIAKTEAESFENTFIAYNMGPIGELIEPAGDLSFDKAYELFAEQVKLAYKYGADLIAIETITDLYEMKAALLAVKENSDLAALCCMTFDENMRTFQGTDIRAMAVTLEGLGADAIGINCSLGPSQILPIAKELISWTNLPVIVKANAGLPCSDGLSFSVNSQDFAEVYRELLSIGVSVIGGCCGTTPDYIALLKQISNSFTKPLRQPLNFSCVSSASKAVKIDSVKVIGERLNPTGKKLYKAALINDDIDFILRQAIEQADAGADILDLNAGLPDIDETAVMLKCIKRIQSVVDLPLQIDSSNPKTIEIALRYYNGKPIVNSVNGDEDTLNAILPFVKKYGAAVVGLTLDKNGIPETVEQRIKIAEKILNYAEKYGISANDVFIDPLTLTVSTEQKQVDNTLAALEIINKKMGLNTLLGVSNISFGLPYREVINSTFLAMALNSGLTLPIINPNSTAMMSVIDSYRVLKGNDKNAQNFVEKYSNVSHDNTKQPFDLNQNKTANDTTKNQSQSIQNAANERKNDVGYLILKGLKNQCADATRTLLETLQPMEVIDNHLIPALDKVGGLFEKGTIFLPQLIQSAETAKLGFEEVKKTLQQKGGYVLGKKIILATVKGDIHDLGKNIVKVVLENYGYNIIDLGKNVETEEVVKTAITEDVKLVGLSALMTTTVSSMQETISALKKAKPDCIVMVGGAVLTKEYAQKIGADYYAKDANEGVKIAKLVLG